MAHGADTLQGSHPPTEQHRHQHARAGMPAAARGSDRHGSHPRWCACTAECITQPATACTKSQSGEGRPTLRQGSHGGKSPKQGPNKPGRSRDPNLSASKRQPINEPHTTLIAEVSQFFSYHYFPIPPHICLDAALTGSIVPCQTYDYLGSLMSWRRRRRLCDYHAESIHRWEWASRKNRVTPRRSPFGHARRTGRRGMPAAANNSAHGPQFRPPHARRRQAALGFGRGPRGHALIASLIEGKQIRSIGRLFCWHRRPLLVTDRRLALPADGSRWRTKRGHVISWSIFVAATDGDSPVK